MIHSSWVLPCLLCMIGCFHQMAPPTRVSTNLSATTVFALQDPPRGASREVQYYWWLAEAGRARAAHSPDEVVALDHAVPFAGAAQNCGGLALALMRLVLRLETGEIPTQAVPGAMQFRHLLPTVMSRCLPAGSIPSGAVPSFQTL